MSTTVLARVGCTARVEGMAGGGATLSWPTSASTCTPGVMTRVRRPSCLHARGDGAGLGEGRGSFARARAVPEGRGGEEEKARELWKREGGQGLPGLDLDSMDAERVREDAMRLAKKQELERLMNASYRDLLSSSSSEDDDDDDEEGKSFSVREAVDKILVADFFLISLALVWFLTGVLQQSISGGKEDGLLQAWLRLWDPLFQPAIGVFMGAAAISALAGKMAEGKNKK